jgi:phage tail-like protein
MTEPTTKVTEPTTPTELDLDKLAENRFRVDVVPKVHIGEFRECTGLSVEREILEYAAGARNDVVYKLPGRVKYGNLVLKRGTTAQGELVKWFRETQSSLKLAIVTVTLLHPTGDDARIWAFKEAYPVKWSGPNLNAGSDSPATETLEIAFGGMDAFK